MHGSVNSSSSKKYKIEKGVVEGGMGVGMGGKQGEKNIKDFEVLN